jgi:molecular chaperone DnaK (HSP70)
MAADNKRLGTFDLVGIPPAPRGTPQIEVTFDIDANGIVNVSARDKATGREQQITIQSSGGLSDAEVEQMVRDSEANAEADKRRKELIERKNAADSLIYSSEKSLSEYKDKIDQETYNSIDEGIKDLRSSLETEEDPDKLREKTDALQQLVMKIGENVYKGSGGASDAGADNSTADADYTEKEESKESKSN